MDESDPDRAYVPFGSRPVTTAPRAAPPRTASTRSSQIMAVLPLVALFLDILLFGVNGEKTTWAILAFVTVAALASSYGLAVLDQRRLAELGFVIRTTPLIALFCPVAYLFTRGSRAWREAATGLTAAWLHVLIIVIVAGLLYELPVVLAAFNGLTSAGI